MSRGKHLVFVLLVCFSGFLETSACNACVQLTEYTFKKIIDKFEATMVKFDVAFPYGDKHEIYSELAKDAKTTSRVLFAEVGIKDYGERDNEAIAKKYGIAKEDYPVVMIFLKQDDQSFKFTGEFTTQNLRAFIRERAEIHLSYPGCLPDLDTISFRFMRSDDRDRRELLKLVNAITAAYEDKNEIAIGKVYYLLLQRVMEKGNDYVFGENERVKKLIEGKISPEKKAELTSRLNILKTFTGETQIIEKRTEL